MQTVRSQDAIASDLLPGAPLLEHRHPAYCFPQQAPGLLLIPILTAKDMHTKCFLITPFVADAVVSLDFTAITFPHRFILSYSP